MQLNNELIISKKQQVIKAMLALKRAKKIEKKRIKEGYKYIRDGKTFWLRKIN